VRSGNLERVRSGAVREEMPKKAMQSDTRHRSFHVKLKVCMH
jgi:hypothetical protein